MHDCTSVALKVSAKENSITTTIHILKMWSTQQPVNKSKVWRKPSCSPPCCSTYYKQPFFFPPKQPTSFFPSKSNHIFCLCPPCCLSSTLVATRNCATQHSWNFQRGQSRKNAGGQHKSWLKERMMMPLKIMAIRKLFFFQLCT